MECPKCGFVCENSCLECPRCGLVFSKLKQGFEVARMGTAGPARQSRSVATVPGDNALRAYAQVSLAHGTDDQTFGSYVDNDEELHPEPRYLERNDWLVLASGPVFALLIMCVPFLNHIFMTFATLVHEMGHTLTGWVFGYPALPAFDLQYGGGVTATMPRSTLLLVVFYAVMAFLVYTYRKNRMTLSFLVLCLAIHVVLSVTILHDVVFLFMGHGMELVIAGVFFYRALSGAAVVHVAERPLYCIISWFLVMSDFRFAYQLATSAHVRRMYEEAKGGGHWMDFSRIAEDYLHTDLKVVAVFFFLTTLLPLVLGYLAFRYQEYLRVLVVRMWVRDPLQACVCELIEVDEHKA